jgi:hypothetical protein
MSSGEKPYAGCDAKILGANLDVTMHALPRLPGDFYHEADDVVRGITLPFEDTVNVSGVFAAGELGKGHFQNTDVPPVLSEETEAYLATTTLRLSGSASAVGNNLLTFLRKAVDSNTETLKINPNKFTIRTEVMLDGFPCEIKVRIYKDGQSILVEFQRRSGDAVAFVKLYHQASLHLQADSREGPFLHQSILDDGKVQEIPHTGALPPDRAIAPLLDMANFSQDVNLLSRWHVNLLSEVASALATMSEDPQVAPQLHVRMQCGLSVLEKLRQVDDFSVAFPTRMLSCF